MRHNIKSITLVVLFAGTFVLGILPDAQAKEKECSLATLKGEYLVTGGAQARFDQRDDPSFPRTAVAVWRFDGEGGLTGFTYQNQGGRVTGGGEFGPGITYDMDPDRCVTNVVFPNQGIWRMVITRDGSEGAGIRVNPDPTTGLSSIATRFMKKRD